MTICTLGKDKAKAYSCKRTDCRSCGWEKTENEQRKFLIAKYGLSKKADGTMGLILGGVKEDT